MSRLVLGVVGHVDHGKTALVRALTGMETDRLPEEQARGISIALGFAHLRTGEHEIDFIDMPGHERFVRTMVAGATGMDAILLVIDAREAIMPQTREHLDIAALLGIRRAIIAISRSDVADAPQIAATTATAQTLVAASGLVAAPPIPCSARTAQGIPALLAAITAELPQSTPRPDDGAPWLPIDRAFSMPGHGTIVTGTLRGGTLSTGDTIEILPSATPARIRALQVHGRRVTTAAPGQRVAVNLRQVAPDQVPRGTALAIPGQLTPTAWITVQLHAVPDAPPLPTNARLHLLFGTAEIPCRLRLLDRDLLAPGDTALAQLHTSTPICVPARARFVLRTPSPTRTIAGGSVLDPQTTRQRRHAPGILSHLATLADAAPAAIVRTELTRATSGTTLTRLARLAGIGTAQAAALANHDPILTRSGDIIAAAPFAALLTQLQRTLASHPDGLPQFQVATLLAPIPPAIIEEAATRLIAAGTLARQGALLRIPRPDHDKTQATRQQAQAASIAETLRTAGLAPPDPKIIAPDVPTRRLLDQLVRAGIVIRAPDPAQGREILFHRDAIEAARRQLTPMLEGQGLSVSQVGAALGISRKFSVPLLEHLDSIRFTRRIAERRVLATPR